LQSGKSRDQLLQLSIDTIHPEGDMLKGIGRSLFRRRKICRVILWHKSFLHLLHEPCAPSPVSHIRTSTAKRIKSAGGCCPSATPKTRSGRGAEQLSLL